VPRWRRVGGRRARSAWIEGLLVLVCLWVAVHFLGNAWEPFTTPTGECPTVVDRDPGRGLDYACSPTGTGTTPKGWAAAATAGFGLAFAVLAVLLTALLVLRVFWVRSARRAASR
jgi:hypothetical protein